MSVHFELFWTCVPLFDRTAEELKGKVEREKERGNKKQQSATVHIQSQDASKNSAFLSKGCTLNQVSYRDTLRLSSDV